jgi:hypothetical protein
MRKDSFSGLRCLPPFVVAGLWLAPLLFGALAVWLGQDANWDLRNYHYYNAFAFLHGRDGFDLLPSQTPYFYNPLLDLPFYFLTQHFSAVVVGFILGTVQGLNFVLLFMLAYISLRISNPRNKVLVCSALAGLGMLGGGGIAMLGTTFYDNVTSVGVFLSALLVIQSSSIRSPNLEPRTLNPFFSAIPAGMMMGLKLPAVIFCVGLCGAFLFVGGSFHRRVTNSFVFGLGILVGMAITYGYWGWFLHTHYDSPFFPYFNNYFHAPLAPDSSARDMQYVQHGTKNILLFPFIFTKSPFRTGEIPWRDWRIVIVYVLLPLAFGARLLFGRTRQSVDAISETFPTRYLFATAILAYVTWLIMFGIYRYAIPLEMIAPLLIVFAAGMLPLKIQTRGLIAAILLAVVAVSVQPGNWGRRAQWLDHFVEAKIPPLGNTHDLMILMAGFEPYSHLVTQFPLEIPFVRIQSNFASPNEDKGINTVLRDRVAAHKGRFMLLIPPWQHSVAVDAVPYFHLKVSAEACQTVTDRLYNDTPMDLCKVVRE